MSATSGSSSHAAVFDAGGLPLLSVRLREPTVVANGDLLAFISVFDVFSGFRGTAKLWRKR